MDAVKAFYSRSLRTLTRLRVLMRLTYWRAVLYLAASSESRLVGSLPA